jgi:hypothetical protein
VVKLVGPVTLSSIGVSISLYLLSSLVLGLVDGVQLTDLFHSPVLLSGLPIAIGIGIVAGTSVLVCNGRFLSSSLLSALATLFFDGKASYTSATQFAQDRSLLNPTFLTYLLVWTMIGTASAFLTAYIFRPKLADQSSTKNL